MLSDSQHIGSKAFGFGVGTGISRVLGLVREVCFAHLFGAGMAMDAFRVAFNIPNLLRDLIAEGTLTPSFIPIFSDYWTKEGKEKAYNFANLVFGTIIIISCIIAIIGIAFAPLWTRIVAFGFIKTPDKFALTVSLVRIIFPFLIFITISALVMGILNFRGHFFTTGIAPVGFNIAIIATGFALFPRFGIKSIAIGAILGAILQILIQVPCSIKQGFRFKPTFNLRDPDVKRVLCLMAPIALGYGATKVNTIVNILIASFLADGAISYISYAFRLMWLPVGVIGVALANVTLPLISKQVSISEQLTVNSRQLKDTIYKSLQYCIFLTIPLCVIMFFFAEPICRLLYGHGRFTPEAVINTASALKFYTIAIFGISVTKILASCFYALKDTKTPMKVSFWTIGVNAVFALVFVRVIGFRALALATSMASLVNAVVLWILLKKRLTRF